MPLSNLSSENTIVHYIPYQAQICYITHFHLTLPDSRDETSTDRTVPFRRVSPHRHGLHRYALTRHVTIRPDPVGGRILGKGGGRGKCILVRSILIALGGTLCSREVGKGLACRAGNKNGIEVESGFSQLGKHRVASTTRSQLFSSGVKPVTTGRRDCQVWNLKCFRNVLYLLLLHTSMKHGQSHPVPFTPP